jgi:FkbM family methyltransferase
LNINYLLGSTFASVARYIRSRRMFPLTRKLPFGSDWLFDVQRFSGTKAARHIVDAGANVGQTAKAISMYFPNAVVYSFEPVSSTHRQLAQNLRGFPNVKCIPKALGEHAGRKAMLLRRCSETNTLAGSPSRAQDLTGESEEVEIVTLDEFCSSRKVPDLDILKMDVQGWELNVLKGASRLLGANRIRFVYSEVGFTSSDPETQNFSVLNEFMEANGFTFSGFYEPFRYGGRREFLGFCNALYMNAAFSAG